MNQFETKYGFSEEEWNACLKVLQHLKDKPIHNPDNLIFGTLITKIRNNAKKQLSQHVDRKAIVKEVVKSSTIAKNALKGTTFYGEESDLDRIKFTEISETKHCYACNELYSKVHSFYHRLCPDCAVLNFANRSKRIDLSNRKVILTGGRVKVGYATALKLLRCNADLTITTRFPAIAFDTFQKENDYHSWKDKLSIYGLDLRSIQDVEKFIGFYINKHDSLDILINNAAQTIQYDETYYASIFNLENKLMLENRAFQNANLVFNNSRKYSKSLSQLNLNTDLTRFGQPVDLRLKNSWNSNLAEIDVLELLEVNLINQISPYLLIKGLTPAFLKSTFEHKFIVNVTSSEGQFSYSNKTHKHPHTNMTKAALNMLTHTSAKDYAKDGIYMNCVDVGWISTGAIEPLRAKQFEQGYIPPLDPVDGASRILHPIHETIVNNKTIFGKLIKNYKIENW